MDESMAYVEYTVKDIMRGREDLYNALLEKFPDLTHEQFDNIYLHIGNVSDFKVGFKDE